MTILWQDPEAKLLQDNLKNYIIDLLEDDQVFVESFQIENDDGQPDTIHIKMEDHRE